MIPVVYLLIYLVLLKIVPLTLGSLTLAFLFSLIITAISELLNKIFRFRTISIVVAGIIFLGAIAFSIYGIFPIMVNEGKKVVDFLGNFSEKSIEEMFPWLEEGSKALEFAQDVLNWLGKTFTSGFGNVATFLVSKIPDIATSATLLVIASIYIALTLPKIGELSLNLFPKSDEERARSFLVGVYSNMRRFITGQLINAFIVGLIVWFGMVIFSIKYSAFFGVLAGITDFIPFLGVVITAIPSIFVGVSQKGLVGIFQVVLVLTVANQVEGWILAPKVIGNQVKLNWFAILVTMIALSEVYGFIGVLISVPFLIVLREIWRYYLKEMLGRG